MYRINNMKKFIQDLKVFRKYFRVRQEVSDEIKTDIYFINYNLQTYIENNIYFKKREQAIWLNGNGQKNCSL